MYWHPVKKRVILAIARTCHKSWEALPGNVGLTRPGVWLMRAAIYFTGLHLRRSVTLPGSTPKG